MEEAEAAQLIDEQIGDRRIMSAEEIDLYT